MALRQPPGVSVVAAAPAQVEVRLLVDEPAPNAESDTPRASVSVEVVGAGAAPSVVEVGVLNGYTDPEARAAPLLRTMRCWWSSGGDLNTVAHEGGAIVVRRQSEGKEVAEAMPNAEIGRVRVGDATVLGTLSGSATSLGIAARRAESARSKGRALADAPRSIRSTNSRLRPRLKR